MSFRNEKDQLGEIFVPENALYGIHTQRALNNFNLAGRPSHPELIHAYGTVKQACAEANYELGYWDDEVVAESIIQTSREVTDGLHDEEIPVDSLQGGAGTSLNMNINYAGES